MTVSSKYHCCLPLCLESTNMTSRRSSRLQRDYFHQQPSRPSPSTLRLLCGRLCHLYFFEQPSWAATFTGHKAVWRKAQKFGLQRPYTKDDSTTNTSASCSPFHSYQLNTSSQSSIHFNRKQQQDHFKN